MSRIFHHLTFTILAVGSLSQFGTGQLDNPIKFFSIFSELFYKTPPPQAKMSTPQMIQHNGYNVEEHKVETADGYILTMFRIPHKKMGVNVNKGEQVMGRPVVLQHGDFCSSDDWLLLPANVALPYILSEEGHDVWLGNARGNTYSMAHVSLTPNDPKFWDFSFDELGIYDIPAVVAYILNVTKYDRLNWVGHSAGTATFFIALAESPQLNQKVDKMVALSPSFSIANSRFRLETLVPAPILGPYFGFFTGGRLIDPRLLALFHRLVPPICAGRIPQNFCKNIIYFVGGNNPAQLTEETVSLIAGHTPSETSGKLIIHMGQSVKMGHLRRFDYGPKGNMEKYGRSTPPEYNLKNVVVPIQAFYGLNDVRNHPKDAKKTMSLLGNVVEAIQVADPKWTHLDFIYGKDAKFFVYDKVIEFLNEMNKFS